MEKEWSYKFCPVQGQLLWIWTIFIFSVCSYLSVMSFEEVTDRVKSFRGSLVSNWACSERNFRRLRCAGLKRDRGERQHLMWRLWWGAQHQQPGPRKDWPLRRLRKPGQGLLQCRKQQHWRTKNRARMHKQIQCVGVYELVLLWSGQFKTTSLFREHLAY